MIKDYKKILPEILKKLRPSSGKLEHTIYSDSDKALVSLSIEIESNEFKYTDPFYGEVDAEKHLKEFANLDLSLVKKKYNSIRGLENQTIYARENEISGWFSNSLEIVTTKIEFGKISPDNKIKTTINFFLTKSETYPALTGEVADHKQYSSEISLNLNLGSLLFLDKRLDKTAGLEHFIDADIYDLKSKEETDLYVREDGYKYLRIELRLTA